MGLPSGIKVELHATQISTLIEKGIKIEMATLKWSKDGNEEYKYIEPVITTGNKKEDIAIIKLKKKLTITHMEAKGIRPIALPRRTLLSTDKYWVIGYGKTEGADLNKLFETDKLKLTSDNKCE